MNIFRPDNLRITAFLTLSGILLGIGFAPLHLGVLAYIGFLPLLVVLERTSGVMQTLRRLYWTFFVFQGVSNWWVSSWQREADPYLMAAGIALWLGHPLFFAVPMFGYTFLHKRLGRASALAMLPFLWAAFEWLHGLGEASYPWQALGYTQAFYTPLIQIADITGVWGLSWCIVAVNALLAACFFTFSGLPVASDSLAVRLTKTLYLCRLQVVSVLGLLLCMLGYGVWQVRNFQHEALLQSHKSVSVGIIQPNINPWGKWQGSAQEQVALHLHLVDSLRLHLPKGVSRLDFTLWSETAIPYRILIMQNFPYLDGLRAWTDSTGIGILSGLPTDRIYRTRAEAPITASVIPRMFDTLYAESFNSAMMLAPRTDITHSDPFMPYPPAIAVHRKMKLTPFAERVPYAEKISFAVKALTWGVGISGWGLGREQKPLPLKRELDTAQIGAVICIESIYPAFVADYARKGATLLVVITNDGWFNHTPGPEQHYMIAAMRAVESKRYLARCGNTGVSGFLTPLGTSLQRTEIDTQTALAQALPLLTGETLYVRFGDWLPIASCLLVALALGASFVKRRSVEE
ncbi:MAG: apolipoprotein N-acyltransferase [Candidatus Kapabacteria bacterium]|nr:apolipoprotein N-acyltransferase [Candidatus Kapabacteria bacterium]